MCFSDNIFKAKSPPAISLILQERARPSLYNANLLAVLLIDRLMQRPHLLLEHVKLTRKRRSILRRLLDTRHTARRRRLKRRRHRRPRRRAHPRRVERLWRRSPRDDLGVSRSPSPLPLGRGLTALCSRSRRPSSPATTGWRASRRVRVPQLFLEIIRDVLAYRRLHLCNPCLQSDLYLLLELDLSLRLRLLHADDRLTVLANQVLAR